MADEGQSDPIDTRLVRRLAAILKDTGLSEIEVERGDLRIRVARELTVAAAPVHYAAAPVAAAPAPAGEPTTTESLPAGDVVKSPMVGTIYLKPSPEAAPFVRVGDQVAAGQTLLIVEAMKTMNPIIAPRSGIIRAVLVADAQPVEYGEPLAVIE